MRTWQLPRKRSKAAATWHGQDSHSHRNCFSAAQHLKLPLRSWNCSILRQVVVHVPLRSQKAHRDCMGQHVPGTTQDLRRACRTSSIRSNRSSIVDSAFAQWQVCVSYLQALLPSECFAFHDGGGRQRNRAYSGKALASTRCLELLRWPVNSEGPVLCEEVLDTLLRSRWSVCPWHEQHRMDLKESW